MRIFFTISAAVFVILAVINLITDGADGEMTRFSVVMTMLCLILAKVY